MAKGHVFGLVETIRGHNWLNSLRCKTLDGGELLMIPVENLHLIMDQYEYISNDIKSVAKELEENLISQIRSNHYNHIHISLGSQLKQHKRSESQSP